MEVEWGWKKERRKKVKMKGWQMIKKEKKRSLYNNDELKL